MTDQSVSKQNYAALKDQHYFADWESHAIRRLNPHAGTVIDDYQRLDRLQAIKRSSTHGGDE